MNDLWGEMGHTTGNGRDMTSVMYRMSGPPIHEQTLGSADAMLLRLLDGDESMGGTKQPYDPRIHFVLIRDAYRDANPENTELLEWLDIALATFDEIYADKRPGFIEGYKKLKPPSAPGAPNLSINPSEPDEPPSLIAGSAEERLGGLLIPLAV